MFGLEERNRNRKEHRKLASSCCFDQKTRKETKEGKIKKREKDKKRGERREAKSKRKRKLVLGTREEPTRCFG